MLRLLPQLAGLRRLKIYDTAVSSLPPELGELPRLTELELVNNKVLKALPPELGNLRKLAKLWISGTPIVSVPAEVRRLKKQLTLEKVQGVPGW